ncbi:MULTISPECIES: biopolymer transporter ExbD [unclassified Novosphingobium]|uniref:ExbD/TolR family protein n=1 Tax=unclassified Novosphingobium TaxID=2644732 RepID=UPI000EBB2881|nr:MULTISPECIES: biopolymer transporter ExbD [unclassified Novosphingobium]HCF25278.1 biopolymer transporter ExbD [Novosphingobium sp.]HQV02546.1 biopolymer transporter ExbD [Novosphingobium sp.]
MAQTLIVNDGPLAELNTTPLIDVMLVLLVMFILSVPTALHQTSFNLPRSDGTPPKAPILPENMVSLTSVAEIRWNGQAVSEGQLVSLLQASTHRQPEPLIRFEPESGAPYGASLRVLNLIRATDPAAFAFSGNEKYADFAAGPKPAR